MAETKKAATAAVENDEVTVILPRTESNEDVFVSVNAETWMVKRGVPVKLPKRAAFVLEKAQMMENAALDYSDEKQKKAGQLK